MMPIDIVKLLTAAAPIAASVASIVNNEKREPENIERKETPVSNNISISITNNFYSNPSQDVMKLSSNIEKQILDTITSSGPRYII